MIKPNAKPGTYWIKTQVIGSTLKHTLAFLDDNGTHMEIAQSYYDESKAIADAEALGLIPAK